MPSVCASEQRNALPGTDDCACSLGLKKDAGKVLKDRGTRDSLSLVYVVHAHSISPSQQAWYQLIISLSNPVPMHDLPLARRSSCQHLMRDACRQHGERLESNFANLHLNLQPAGAYEELTLMSTDCLLTNHTGETIYCISLRTVPNSE